MKRAARWHKSTGACGRRGRVADDQRDGMRYFDAGDEAACAGGCCDIRGERGTSWGMKNNARCGRHCHGAVMFARVTAARGKVGSGSWSGEGLPACGEAEESEQQDGGESPQDSTIHRI